jgi:hypothetical protein
VEVLCADHPQVVAEVVEIVQIQIIIVMLVLVHLFATLLIADQECAAVFQID